MPKKRRLRFLQALVDAGPDLSARFLSVSRNNAALQVSDQLQVDDPVARCECVHTRNAREGAVQGKRAVGHDGRNLTNAAEESAGSRRVDRSEEHTSELQSLMRNSYAVFCLTKKTNRNILETKTIK